MRHYARTSARVAHGRLSRYVTIATWLGKAASRIARKEILLSIFASMVSVKLQVIPLLLIMSLLSRLEPDLSPTSEADVPTPMTSVGTLDIQLSNEFIVVIVVVLLAISGLAQYFSRHYAVEAERRVMFNLGNELIDEIAANDQVHARWLFNRNFDMRFLMKALLRGVRFCGLSTRLFVSNTLSFFYLVAGFGVLVAISPYLFIMMVIILVLSLLLNYPLSMRAVRLGRAFEESQAARSKSLRARVREAVEGSPAQESDDGRELTTPGQRAAPAERKYLEVLGNRLRLLELSRFVYTILFAITVGVLLWLIVDGTGADFLDYGYLLLLFMSFRYTFIGLQGVMVLVTSTNRFMPQIQRVYQLVEALRAMRERPSERQMHYADPANWPDNPEFSWRIGDDDDTAVSGKFVPGSACIIAVQDRNKLGVVLRLLEILQNKRQVFLGMYRDADLASAQPAPRSKDLSEEDRNAKAAWITSLCQEADIKVEEEDVIAFLSGKTPAGKAPRNVINQLSTIYEPVHGSNPLIIFNNDKVLRQKVEMQNALRERCKDRIVIHIVRWSDNLQERAVADWLFVCGATEFTFFAPLSEMSDEEWIQAHEAYKEGEGDGDDGDMIDEFEDQM